MTDASLAIDVLQNDFAAVFASLTQSHRLWTRAADNISRLSQSSSSVKPLASPSEPKTNGLVNPFEVAKPAGQDPAAQPSADEVATKVIKKPLFFGIQLNGTQWRVSEVSRRFQPHIIVWREGYEC
jgi:hypothetical protein